jgi:3-hydroxybutyryl-CoA dehydrogenase
MTRVGVVGAGTMGTGIAIVSCRAGMPTVLFDISSEATIRASAQVDAFLNNSVAKGKLTPDDAAAARSNLVTSNSSEGLSDVTLLIEAVFESLPTKTALLGSLNHICPPETIFASNTSTLSITELAAGSGRPDRFVGMHFCLPAPLMRLVELTPGLDTSDEVFATAWRICEAMGQRPVHTQDRPGFILNAYLVPFNNDAIRLIDRGVAAAEDIDLAVKVGLGYPMGPCELLDYIGLDTQVLLSEALYASTHDPRAECPPLLRRMVAAGRLGRKSGRGFYQYADAKMFGA